MDSKIRCQCIECEAVFAAFERFTTLLATRFLFLYFLLFHVVDEPPAPLPAPFIATLVGDAPAPLAKTTPDAPNERARDKAIVLAAFRNVDFIGKLLR
jgi:hypothetical protein